MSEYRFPVELEKVYLKSGVDIPNVRAVVRKDMELPIATVSDRYQIVKHDHVFDSAEKFISVFGEPERRFNIAKNGARVVAEYTYRDAGNLLTIQRGDSSVFASSSRIHTTRKAPCASRSEHWSSRASTEWSSRKTSTPTPIAM
jgi:hypothetical protein